jgi:hypothetical protein
MSATALRFFIAVVALCALVCAEHAKADSWMPPSTQTYVSSDEQTQAVVVPRPLRGSLHFFEDKVKGRTLAGQASDSAQTHPIVYIRRRTDDGRWTPVRQWPLVNDVAPVHALVANGGKYLATFDNWHMLGHGDDAIVIYDARGRLIRKYALSDFLPVSYIETLPMSVSSIQWQGDHYFFDDDTLLLQVAEPSFDHDDSTRLYVSVRIRLADGAMTLPSGRAWERALRKSKKVRAQQQAYARDACERWGGGWCLR